MIFSTKTVFSQPDVAFSRNGSGVVVGLVAAVVVSAVVASAVVASTVIVSTGGSGHATYDGGPHSRWK